MNTQTSETIPAGGLSQLSQVKLSLQHTAMLAAARTVCGGGTLWRERKLIELVDLWRLVELSGRLTILGLDVRADLRAELLLRVTVPCLPKPDGPLAVAQAARLGIIYREAALVTPQPGYSFVQILAPQPVWHPNVSPDMTQAVCLGPSIPPGLPLREIILMVYGALSMMSVQLDPGNSAGVLNPAAADWFQRNPVLIPLTREPFVQPLPKPYEKQERC